jgi:dienelactone hydrolase
VTPDVKEFAMVSSWWNGACRDCLGAGAVLAIVLAPASGGAAVVQETIDLAVEVTDVRGEVVNHSIKVAIMRDDARASSPFLVLNHGRGATREINAKRRVTSFNANARYFVSKGFAVFMPLRVGYGETAGPDVEFSGKCRDRNFPPVYEAAVAQTVRVIQHAKTLPYIDRANGLVVGQSFGGATAIGVAAKNLDGVKAAINFAGGGGGRPKTHHGEPCSVDRLTALFASYGTTAQVPTLWLYSENDRYWGAQIPRTWFDAFIARGGNGRFVSLPPYKNDGHAIFSGNRDAWTPAFEAFLQSCCLDIAAKGGPALADQATGSDTPQVFTLVLHNWASKYKVKQAIMVVRHQGRVVHRAAIGGADSNRPVLLASLSKAITGACIATLVRDGKLTFDTPLSRALASYFERNGRPDDPRLERTTIAHLLTHRSGLPGRDDGNDAATGGMLKTYLANHSPREPATPAYLSAVLSSKLESDRVMFLFL